MSAMSALLFVALLAGAANLAAADGWGYHGDGYGHGQSQSQFGGNVAKNVGTANQQNNQQALEQNGNNNFGSNFNDQSIKTGRKLLGSWYPQYQSQFGGNVAKNVGTANQQNNQQALEQNGNDNFGFNDNSQSIDTTGRKLLDWNQYQNQFGGNVAKNVGTANQQNSQQALEQNGNDNFGYNYNDQDINTGRRLLGDGKWVYYPTQYQSQFGGNIAENVATANQQNSQQALEQDGSDNFGSNYNDQDINTGRKLQGWYQNQNQVGGNVAKNVGTANQQNSQQALEQNGKDNFGSNYNSQSIQTGPPAKKP